MGMRINLVDRGIYSLETTDTNSSLQDLRQTLLGKRDEFILSDKDSTAFMQHLDQINDEHTQKADQQKQDDAVRLQLQKTKQESAP